MIEVQHITQTYRKITALADVSFKIRNGKTYALTGSDRAGKSTVMNLLSGCLCPTDGKILINGYDMERHPTEAKKQIGYLPERAPLFRDLTVFESLFFVAKARKIPSDEAERQVDALLSLAGLTDVADRLCRYLTPVQRVRAGLILASVGNPDILLLDEPLRSLDRDEQGSVRDLIRTLGESRTVLISAVSPFDVCGLCEHIITLTDGVVTRDEDIPLLPTDGQAWRLTVRVSRTSTVSLEEIPAVLSAVEGILDVIKDDGHPVQPDTAAYLVMAENRPDIQDHLFFALSDHRVVPMAFQAVETAETAEETAQDKPADPVLSDESGDTVPEEETEEN